MHTVRKNSDCEGEGDIVCIVRDPKGSVPAWLPCTCQSRIIDWAVSIENEADGG